MVFTEDNKAFIKIFHLIISYGLQKLTREFPGK